MPWTEEERESIYNPHSSPAYSPAPVPSQEEMDRMVPGTRVILMSGAWRGVGGVIQRVEDDHIWYHIDKDSIYEHTLRKIADEKPEYVQSGRTCGGWHKRDFRIDPVTGYYCPQCHCMTRVPDDYLCTECRG